MSDNQPTFHIYSGGPLHNQPAIAYAATAGIKRIEAKARLACNRSTCGADVIDCVSIGVELVGALAYDDYILRGCKDD
jgi:hypothetical protein